MDTAEWPEGIGMVKPMEERKPRPQKPQALNCPRCNSSHTKFCYYNNYSLSQPRYFCKTCRRYWTEGGSLRNVPVGGGSRKNKRSSSPSSTSKKVTNPDHYHPLVVTPGFSTSQHQNPNKIHDQQGQDLSLAYNPTPTTTTFCGTFSQFVELPCNPNNSTSSNSNLSAMEFLKSSGIVASKGGMMMSSFLTSSMPLSDSSSNPNNNIHSAAGLPFQEFKPTLNFSLDGFENSNGYGSLQGVQETGSTTARLFFPFENSKPVSGGEQFELNNRGQAESTSGYWNGGSW